MYCKLKTNKLLSKISVHKNTNPRLPAYIKNYLNVQEKVTYIINGQMLTYDTRSI